MRRTTALLGLSATLLLVSCGGEPSPAELEASAETACKAWVREQLKAPSTAEFADLSTVNAQADFTEQDVYDGLIDKSMYTVEGSVDSENSFGAMLRASFVCETRHTEETWQLVSIDVG